MFETMEAKGEITKEKMDRSHCTEELEDKKKIDWEKCSQQAFRDGTSKLCKILIKRKKNKASSKLDRNYKPTQDKVLFFLFVSKMHSIKISIVTTVSWTSTK